MFSRMQIIRFILIVPLFFNLANDSRATEMASCPTRSKLALELLKLELSGQRYPQFEGSCVSKLKSLAIRVRHLSVEDPSYKMSEKPVFASKKDITITKIEKTDFPDRFKVSFQVKNAELQVHDSFVMELFSGEVQKISGCAAIAEPPQHFWLFPGCEKK